MLNSDKICQLMSSMSFPKSGCWLWKRATQRGYGAVWDGKKVVRVHRLIFSLANPTVDIQGKCICHHCDIKACANPDHLYAGNKSTNYKDALRRGQIVPLRGEAHPRAKLSANEVSKIRALLKQGCGKRELGRKFGVDHSQIVRISSGEIWKGIE